LTHYLMQEGVWYSMGKLGGFDIPCVRESKCHG
jgi:hypothetical protein